MLRAGFGGDDAKLEQLMQYHPVGRIGRPDEVASLCLYLCSDAAQFINGAVFELNGGISARLHDPS
jgi:NAD(P)-dependent dehydrogenase (short-subunit alcohol dehydrogenase family)